MFKPEGKDYQQFSDNRILATMSRSVAQSGLYEEGTLKGFTPFERLLNDNKYTILNKVYIQDELTYYIVRGVVGNVFFIRLTEPFVRIDNFSKRLALEAEESGEPVDIVDVNMVKSFLECQNDAMCSVASVCDGGLCFTQAKEGKSCSSRSYRFSTDQFNGAVLEDSPLIYPVITEAFIAHNPLGAQKEIYELSKRAQEKVLGDLHATLKAYLGEVEGLKKAIEGTISYANSIYGVNGLIDRQYSIYTQTSQLLTESSSRAQAEVALQQKKREEIEKKWKDALGGAQMQKSSALGKIVEYQNLLQKMIQQVGRVVETYPIVKNVRTEISATIDPASIAELDKVLDLRGQVKKSKGWF